MIKTSSFAEHLSDEYKRLTTALLYFRNGSVLTGLSVLCTPSNGFQLFPMLPLAFGTSVNCGVTARFLETRGLDTATVLFCVLSAFSVVLSLIACVRYKQAKNKKKVSAMLIFLVLSVQYCIAVEQISGFPIVKAEWSHNAINMLFYVFLFGLGVVLFPNPKWWLAVCCLLLTGFGVAQHYVQKFRLLPIRFSDIYNIASACTVKSNYQLKISPIIVYAALNLIGTLAVLKMMPLKRMAAKQRICCLVTFVATFGMFLLTVDKVFKHGIVYQRLGNVGFDMDPGTFGCFTFMYYDALYNKLTVPYGYTKERARSILSSYAHQAQEMNRTPRTLDDKPDIICIMNESFADFRTIGTFRTNEDPTPFLTSLRNSTVNGFVTVSAYGGHSANSEFEFLTGGSMLFVPPGMAPFMSYLNHPHDGLVRQLKRLGYTTSALAVSDMESWNKGIAYQMLGFDSMTYKHNFTHLATENIRRQVSDKSLFKKVIEEYEKRDKRVPYFVWATTMQNHGGYDWVFDDGVRLEDPKDPEAETYLNLIHRSDSELKRLVEYLKTQRRHIVLLMFGDHFPHIESFTTRLYGKRLADLTLAERSRIQKTPFVIWSNRPIAPKRGVETSLSYLSALLADVAGLPKTEAQLELEHLRRHVPLVNGFGFMGDDGKWHAPREESEYAKYINEYHIIHHYRLFDQWNDTQQIK